MQMYSEADVDLACLADRQITILGYGSQGRAHALNLKDSGFNVVVGLRAGGASWPLAEADGLTVMEPGAAVKGATIVAFLTPDMVQKRLYESLVDDIAEGATLLFAHGFAVHFKQVEPRADLNVVLIAPKGPGGLVRRQYEEGHGVPCLVAVHQDAGDDALNLALAYASGIGGARAGVIKTTFAEETETDLFGEQAVLCGGATELIVAGFETLVEAGYKPEIDFFEGMHEVKLIVDLIYQGGLSYMRYSVSNTAEYGDLSRGPRIVTEETRAEMKKILDEVTSGKFAKEWVGEFKGGLKNFNAMYEKDHDSQLEEVGRKLRRMMKWIDAKEV